MLHTLHVITHITSMDLQWKFPLIGIWVVVFIRDNLRGIHMGVQVRHLGCQHGMRKFWLMVGSILLISQAYPLGLGFCCRLFVCFLVWLLVSWSLVIILQIFSVSVVGWGFLGYNWWWVWCCSVVVFDCWS